MRERNIFTAPAVDAFRVRTRESLPLALAEVSVPAQGEWTATVTRGGGATERFEELLAHLPAATRDELRRRAMALLRSGLGVITDGVQVWTEDRITAGMLYYVHPPMAAAS